MVLTGECDGVEDAVVAWWVVLAHETNKVDPGVMLACDYVEPDMLVLVITLLWWVVMWVVTQGDTDKA